MDNEVIKADDIGPECVRIPELLADAVARFKAIETEPIIESVLESVGPVMEFEPHKRTPAEILELTTVAERFKVALTERSFSGRNPELGPMIKCAQCGQRHRDNVKHEPIVYKEDTKQVEQGRPVGNGAGWRAKPGKPMWIKELKKFVTLTR